MSISRSLSILKSANTNAKNCSDANLVTAKNYSDANLVTAKNYADANLVTAKNYADANLVTAKNYSDANLVTAKNYADSVKPWKDFSFVGHDTTTRLHLDNNARYLMIFNGGSNYKDIVIVFTGSDGTASFTRVLNASGITIAVPDVNLMDVTITGGTTRHADVFTLSESDEPYIVT